MTRDQWKSGVLLGCCLLVLLASPVLAANSTQTVSLAGQIAVTHVEISPSLLMRDDTGLVTITVQNTGSESLTLRGATFSAKELTTVNYQTYASSGTIGPGTTREFTFTIRADPPDGIYYPKFSLDLGTESFRTYIPIQIESTPIDVSVNSRPDTFTQGVKEEITLVIGNPRQNTLTGISVTPVGNGIVSTQTRVFIGDLAPGQSTKVVFTLAPMEKGDVTFLVEYRNGINSHTESVTIPVTFGTDKMAANPLVNNIEIASSGATYTLSADVTNAGLSDARSIVATVGSPAQPTDPYPMYVVGTLEPDDFSSFDLTFLAPGMTSIPLILQYKDTSGNNFETTITVNLQGNGLSSNSTGGSTSSSVSFPDGSPGSFRSGRNQGMFGFGNGFGQIPFLEIAAVLVIGISLVVAWRKRYLGKVLDRLRR